MGRALALAAITAAAALLISAGWAHAAPAADLQEFRVLVAQQIRAKYPGARIVLIERDGLSVTLPGEEPKDQSLARAYAFYRDDPAMLDDVVRDVVKSFAPIPITSESLVVLVRSTDALPGRMLPEGALTRPLVGKLIAIVALDGPDAYDFVKADRLRRALRLDDEAIWSRAMANTRRQASFEPSEFQPGQVAELSTGRGLASSLIADDAFWDAAAMRAAGPIVVAPLARDDILLTALSNKADVDRLRRLMDSVAGDVNNLGEGLIVRRNGRWEILP
jgi:hypothetical protein